MERVRDSPRGSDPAVLHVAIVGAGYIGNRQARVIPTVGGLVVSVVVDPDGERAVETARLVAAAGADEPATRETLAEALADPDLAIDIVVICVPNGMHAELSVIAIEASRHTLIEKPIEVTLAAANAIAAAASRNPGVLVGVISQHRFDLASRIVHEAIEAGRFGTLTSAAAVLPWWRGQQYYDSGDWRGTWALDGGGALMNQGVHNLDLLVWLLGTPVEVFARTALSAHDRIEVEDTLVATLTFESGAIATMLATTAAYPGTGARISVYGSSGSAVIQADRLEYFHVARPGDEVAAYGTTTDGNQADEARGGPEERWPSVQAELEASHRRQWDDFVRALRSGGETGNTVAEATLSLATVRAIYESARLGRPVLVADVLAGGYESVVPAVAGAGSAAGSGSVSGLVE